MQRLVNFSPFDGALLALFAAAAAAASGDAESTTVTLFLHPKEE